MTDWTMQTNVADPQILARRLGGFLNGKGSSKQLALKLDCHWRTAEDMRRGRSWPQARHWLAIWLEFGDDVVEAVFYPERVEARLKREAAEREEARQRRLTSLSLERRSFGVASGLDQALGPTDEPLEPGPPNLDLFETAALPGTS